MATEPVKDQGPPLSVEEAISALTGAAQEAVDTDDYITYSTLLDVYLGTPDKYLEQDQIRLLQTLEEVLQSNETLLSYVAWDLPVLLLPYLASAEPFDTVAASKSESPRKASLKIFNLIAEKGNAKEVFLKAIEALSTLSVDYEPGAEPHQILESEKLFVLKFYALFEVIISVTRRITTQYPSRFLTASSTSLLSFFSSHVDELGDQALPVLLRRLYLFARDYVPPPSKSAVEPEEEALQQRLLQSYATHMVEIMLRAKNVDWTRRMFAAVKPSVDVLPIRERQKSVSFEGAVNANITEMLERFVQLTLSFDITPEDFATTILTIPREDNPEEEDEDDVDPSFPTPPTQSSSIPFSAEGCLLLLSEYLSSDSKCTVAFTFPQIIEISKRFVTQNESGSPSAGVCDAIGMLGWKFLIDVKPEQIKEVDTEDFNGYLQILTTLSATSPIPDVRFAYHVLVVHLLSRSGSDRAYEYIFDTLMYCPFENVRSSFVVVLKDFLKKGPSDSRQTAIDYDDAKREQIEALIKQCTTEIESGGQGVLDEKFLTLIAWVNNFLPIAGSSDLFNSTVLPQIKAIADSESEAKESTKEMDSEELVERQVRTGILQTGLDLISADRGLQDALENLSVSEKTAGSEELKPSSTT
ncbi:YAP-binding/ALF4/Glomulin [Lipomyces oligophaga]|uniref:YAP-binding/ALF4/Glomulin n=1 Tax=Lipomyces oligophaga TaxID=45792 RepID=UPI0034CE24A9